MASFLCVSLFAILICMIGLDCGHYLCLLVCFVYDEGAKGVNLVEMSRFTS